MRSGRWAWVWRPTLYDKALWVFLVSIMLSVIVSPLLSHSLRAAIPLSLGVLACLMLAKWPSHRGQLTYLWWALVVVGAALALLAPPAMMTPQHRIFRVFPFWLGLRCFLPDGLNANVVAGALVVLIPFALAGVLAHRSIGARLMCLLAAGSMLAVLPLTESRAAYGAVLAAVVVLAALRWPRYTLYAAPFILAALLLLGYRMGGPSVWNRWLQGGVSRSASQRMEIWSRAVLLLQRHPITGAGLGCFERVLSSRYPLYTVPRGAVTHAHNLFLQVGVDLGLPGLISYLSILGLAFYALFTIYGILKDTTVSFLRLLAIACISSLVGLCLHGLVDAATWGNKGTFLPWLVLGVAASLYRLQVREEESSA